MPTIVVDDHLLRDVLVGGRDPGLDGLAPGGIATTNLWFSRLCSSFANRRVAGKLSAPVASLPDHLQQQFRAQLVELPDTVEVLALREIAWSMAVLRDRHCSQGRALSTAMAEALAAAHRLGGGIAVSSNDVGPNLRAATEADGLAFHVL